ncbi:T9SS type A sorting domain-containing protein, partial [candidate division KSB1 bacterium]|nr:T9SS type A sorting domain-containing protein [candidate division KSB1 bacterium]
NTAIITSPRNGHIYTSRVPIEIYFEPTVKSFKVKANGVEQMEQILTASPKETRLNLTISGDLTDYELTFDFFDGGFQLLKSETITILCAKENVKIPSLDLSVVPNPPAAGKTATVTLRTTEQPPFTIENNRVDYVFHPHLGFDPGVARWTTINWNAGRSWLFTSNFSIPGNALVVTFGAGYTIRYGKFSKRIYDQEILPLGTWADAIADLNPISQVENTSPGLPDQCLLMQNYPNPFNNAATLSFSLPSPAPVTLDVFNIRGEHVVRLLQELRPAGSGSVVWDATQSPGGIYFYRLVSGTHTQVRSMLLLR